MRYYKSYVILFIINIFITFQVMAFPAPLMNINLNLSENEAGTIDITAESNITTNITKENNYKYKITTETTVQWPYGDPNKQYGPSYGIKFNPGGKYNLTNGENIIGYLGVNKVELSNMAGTKFLFWNYAGDCPIITKGGSNDGTVSPANILQVNKKDNYNCFGRTATNHYRGNGSAKVKVEMVVVLYPNVIKDLTISSYQLNNINTSSIIQLIYYSKTKWGYNNYPISILPKLNINRYLTDFSAPSNIDIRVSAYDNKYIGYGNSNLSLTGRFEPLDKISIKATTQNNFMLKKGAESIPYYFYIKTKSGSEHKYNTNNQSFKYTVLRRNILSGSITPEFTIDDSKVTAGTFSDTITLITSIELDGK